MFCHSLQQKSFQAELKLVILLVYFTIFLLSVNTLLAIFLAEKDSFKNAVNDYILCEAVGYVSGKCSREEFEQYTHPILNTLFHIIYFLLPVVNLLFAINCRILKDRIEQMKVFKALKALSTTTTSN